MLFVNKKNVNGGKLLVLRGFRLINFYRGTVGVPLPEAAEWCKAPHISEEGRRLRPRAHHSARKRAESQSFPLIYPYTVHHSVKRVSVERNPNITGQMLYHY